MGFGSSTPVTPPTTAAPVTPAAPATPATPDSNAGLSDKQKIAISMLLSQMGKQTAMPSMQQPQMSGQPTTQTIQGGTLINPQQR